ncbi:TonB-dependent receptor [Halosquirtibacter xylanolyticus]|uniref:SusC/RagA family TonB-linked outer membrane protein n=1 Tax=Halosquirtibacter xylanolyticus TaxID=3374599 RepID=UPI00374A81F9|nr:TonB-dependent receptor [Prolixibacteraceae bacterium]
MKRVLLMLVVLCTLGLLQLSAQSRVLIGEVTSAGDGTTIPGVSVVIKNTSIGTVTDFDGRFKIKVPLSAKTLVLSFIGLETKEVEIGDKLSFKIQLKSEAVDVDEVIVVAYGTAKKASFTGSAGVLTAEKLETRPLTSVSQALEGSTTGVQVSTASGQPGSAPAIRIRGFGSLNGNSNPLYVVDGVPYSGTLSDINPEDIASMTILKDASSAALYGSRAANGVVLINTKKGKKGGKTIVNVKALYGVVSRAIPQYEKVGARDYYQLSTEAYKNSLQYGKSQDAATALSNAVNGIYGQLKYNPFNVANDEIMMDNGVVNPDARVVAPNLDWFKPLEQTGKRQNYSANISSSGEKGSHFLSVGYLDEEGYIVSTGYQRFNSRLSSEFNVNDWLKISNNVSFTTSKSQYSVGTGNTSYNNPFSFARGMGSIYPVYMVEPGTGKYILDQDGNKQYDLGGGYAEHNINARPSASSPGRHVVAEMEYNNQEVKTNTISDRFNVDIKLMKGLIFTTNVGIDIRNYKYQYFENTIVGDGAPSGRFADNRYISTTINANQLLKYEKELDSGHSFNVLLGHESYSYDYERISTSKKQVITQGIYEMAQFVTPTNLNGYTDKKRIESYLGRFEYDYNDRYYLSGSYRYDGSSIFNKENRWGGFYSVGASWRIKEENFMQDVSWIDNLKLRASIGEVGNDRLYFAGTTTTDYYAYQALYGTNPNGTSPGLIWSSVGNEDLKWEVNTSYDFALEFGLFDGFVDGSIEYYRKDSKSLLYSMPLAPSQGFMNQNRNIASLTNSGVEVGLNFKWIKKRNVEWSTDFQISTIKNEITDIPDPAITGSKRWDVGRSIYDFYTYDYYGVNPDNGEALYYKYKDTEDGGRVRELDADGNPVLVSDYSAAGKGYVGASSIPDFYGSFTSNLKVHNFTLSVLATYSVGGKTLDYNYAGLMSSQDLGSGMHVDHLNAWQKPGDITDIPRLQVDNPNLSPTSSRWLTDASYLALKNITLSYTFNKSLLKSTGLNKVRIYATGENLFLWSKRTGMDPQESFAGTTSNTFIPSRVMSIGLDVSF